jgi:hypothetical protein
MVFAPGELSNQKFALTIMVALAWIETLTPMEKSPGQKVKK